MKAVKIKSVRNDAFAKKEKEKDKSCQSAGLTNYKRLGIK